MWGGVGTGVGSWGRGLRLGVLKREFTLNFGLNLLVPFRVELSFLKHKRSSDDDLISELTTLSSFQNTTYF